MGQLWNPALALQTALAAPLLGLIALVAGSSGVLAIRQLWIVLGPKHSGPPVAHYVRYLETRADSFENALRWYANNSDDGTEARRVLDLMNGERKP